MSTINVQVEVEQVPSDRILALYQHLATATIGEETFEINRSLTGMVFAVDQRINGETVTHTFSINPVIEAVLDHIREGEE